MQKQYKNNGLGHFSSKSNKDKEYYEPVRPQPSFLSSRGYHFELTFPGYSELRFLPISGDAKKGHVVYWHYTYRQIKTVDIK